MWPAIPAARPGESVSYVGVPDGVELDHVLARCSTSSSCSTKWPRATAWIEERRATNTLLVP
jgi:hypothetical protein